MKHNNITYKFTYNLSTSFLIIIFIEQYEQQQELELKLNLPNRLDINEIIHRLANLNNLIFDYYIMLNERMIGPDIRVYKNNYYYKILPK